MFSVWCSFGKSFQFSFLCSGYSLSCVRDEKFLFGVITVEEIMLCWQPSVSSGGLRMKSFETLVALWGSSSGWGFRSLGQNALRVLCMCLGNSHIIAQSCAGIIFMAQHFLGTSELCPSHCWHPGFLSLLPLIQFVFC